MSSEKKSKNYFEYSVPRVEIGEIKKPKILFRVTI